MHIEVAHGSSDIVRAPVASTVKIGYLAKFWSQHLAAGGIRLPGLPLSPSDQATAAGVGTALAELLRSNLGMPLPVLASAWQSIALCLPSADLAALVATCLPKVPEGESRFVWRLAEMCLDPVAYAEGILRDYPERDLLKYMDGSNVAGFGERLLINDPHASCYYFTLLICAAGPSFSPSRRPDGSAVTLNPGSFAVRRAVRQLAENPIAEAGHALRTFSSDPVLSAWQSELLPAVLVQAAKRRDERFAYTLPSQLSGLLKNGPPLNAADLNAVLATEIGRLRDELRTDDLSPWAQFWNFDGGKLTRPRIENLCRDHLLARLRDRLKRYLITAALPEAQHAGNTRADMLVVSGANARVPVEVKRHMHPEVWTAAGTQLQHYAEHLDAEGNGIYIVLWFGLENGRLPARPGKRPMPSTPEQFQEFLREDLPQPLRRKTEIFVFDVSPFRRTC